MASRPSTKSAIDASSSQAGFGGKLLNWFQSYLWGRRQRITALGAILKDLPVTSGVPQGSLLGPGFFLLYVNVVSSSRVLMFIDDTEITREIRTIGNTCSLQTNLGRLETWSQTSGVPFSKAKSVRLSA